MFFKSFETYLSSDFENINDLKIHEQLVHRVSYG